MQPRRSPLDRAVHNSSFGGEWIEPTATRELTQRAVRILDAKYEAADLPKVVADCKHLTTRQQGQLLKLLLDFKPLFDGSLGEWQGAPVTLTLKPGAKPFHVKRAFPVPQIHKDTLRKEIDRLESIGVLKRQPESEWASPTFIVPKANGTVRVTSDFREVNKLIVRSPYPIPRIIDTLQEMEGFTYASAIDLNMGYYHIRLDPDAQKICTIIFPWGKYSYMRLPMGISNAPDIFQERMSTLMAALEFVKVYLDDLLVITRSDWDDHLDKLRQVLRLLQKAGLSVNAPKSSFGRHEVEYLGYVLTTGGIKPQTKKIQAILALTPPTNIKLLRRFLGMVQYYRDLWPKRSEMLAPLTDLVSECGVTKSTKKKGTKKKSWYWGEAHQQAFDSVKQALARDVMLAYPDYSKTFEIYTDASTVQLGGVITQNNRPLAFFCRKLSSPQTRYTITELELLSIVETLKEFRGMLWGQKIRVYTDHKNLISSALGMDSNRVHRWRLLLEEFGPEIVYIKGIHNTVADAISRLEYDPKINVVEHHLTECEITSCFVNAMVTYSSESTIDESATYDDCTLDGSSNTYWNELRDSNSLFKSEDDTVIQQCEIYELQQNALANCNATNREIYPVTIKEIADVQRKDKALKKCFEKGFNVSKVNDRYSLKVIDDEEVVVCDDSRLVITSKRMQTDIISWYHHYLQHPGMNRMEDTITAVMYWRGIRADIRRHVKTCERCQLSKPKKDKHGHLPPKIAEITPWKCVSVDLIGPYTLKDKRGTILDFMCLTMIDPATGWFEIVELPLASVEVKRKGDEITEVILDKSSAQVSRLFNMTWLCRYPRAKYIIYDNGSEFKLHFKELLAQYNIKQSPTSIKNPQSNAILERIHAVIKNMIRTSGLDNQEEITEDDIADVLCNVAWAIRSTYHTVLRTSPGAAIFGRDMLFDIPYIADWTDIGKRRQASVDKANLRENEKRIAFDYAVGQEVLLRKDGIIRKLEDKYDGPYTITDVHTNGTVRIQRGTVNERVNIRRIAPYFRR